MPFATQRGFIWLQGKPHDFKDARCIATRVAGEVPSPDGRQSLSCTKVNLWSAHADQYRGVDSFEGQSKEAKEQSIGRIIADAIWSKTSLPNSKNTGHLPLNTISRLVFFWEVFIGMLPWSSINHRPSCCRFFQKIILNLRTEKTWNLTPTSVSNISARLNLYWK